MTYPKIKPCPNCKTDERMSVYTYESGGRHVECNKCFYLGPGEGSIAAAIKSHNNADPRDDGPFVNAAEAGGITPSDREQPNLTARDLS